MESIGEKIFNLRKEKGVSQEKLANGLKVARFTVSRWETNAAQPTAENIKALSEFFGVKLSYFFDTAEAAAEADDAQPTEVIPQEIKKESKFKILKIAFAVAGMVLLAFLVAVCGIASYVAISPGAGGEWGKEIHIVNYAGIIYLVLGAVAVSVLIALIVLASVKFIKSAKNK